MQEQWWKKATVISNKNHNLLAKWKYVIEEPLIYKGLQEGFPRNNENTEFDFLSYTFRRRLCKNRRRNSLFVNFTPAVSKIALKAMRLKIRKLRVRMATELSIDQLAKWLNPIIQGWIGYYGRFTRSALYAMCRHITYIPYNFIKNK